MATTATTSNRTSKTTTSARSSSAVTKMDTTTTIAGRSDGNGNYAILGAVLSVILGLQLLD